MILHVRFSDGSNPWVSLPADRHTIAGHWRRWKKHHPDTAVCLAWVGSWVCVWDSRIGRYSVGCCDRNRPEYRYQERRYKTLGRALTALDRLGGAAR